jgi:hypothetical protein
MRARPPPESAAQAPHVARLYVRQLLAGEERDDVQFECTPVLAAGVVGETAARPTGIASDPGA